MQEKSKKGALDRSASSTLPEIHIWLQAGISGLGNRVEIDTNFSGSIQGTATTCTLTGDMDNSTLNSCIIGSVYVSGRQNSINEKCPWDVNKNLWTFSTDPTATARGQIMIINGAGASYITLKAFDNDGNTRYNRVLHFQE